MDENSLSVSSKELFYSAMLLGFDRLVNIEYIFPADDERLAAELDEVKKALHKRKLLKENSKGEITLDFTLSLCAAFCSKPDSCTVVDEEGYYATIYSAADVNMLLEKNEDGEFSALWFPDSETLDGHITQKLESVTTEAGPNA